MSANVTNLKDEKGVATLVLGAASGACNTFPIAPRQYFVTLCASFQSPSPLQLRALAQAGAFSFVRAVTFAPPEPNCPSQDHERTDG
jgi:hypothetical protein